MALIQPSIGRKVWFWPEQEDLDAGVVVLDATNYGPYHQPLDATIVYVHGESLVNLYVLDHEGTAWTFEKVILLPEDRPIEFPVRCVTWMPYQLEQAKKAQMPVNDCSELAAALGMAQPPVVVPRYKY